MKGESDYYPFGGERVISSSVTDSFRFGGMEWDPEDGLNHRLYRKYTPALGRWESPDPERGCVNFPQGQNLYAYVRANPTNLTDPSGAIIAVWCDPSDASTDCSCDPWLDPDCPGWPGGPVEADGGGTGTCTAWYSGEGQAMSVDLCKGHADHPVLQYSWQCTSEAPNSIGCCLTKADAASRYCYKPHEGIFFEQVPTGAGNKYGCCCGKRKNQIYPPVTPGTPY